MTLTFDKNESFPRFVSCVCGAGMLKIFSQVARRAIDGEGLSIFSAGKRFTDDFKPVVTDKNNLIRGVIFRGKVAQWKTQTNKNRLEERTLPAPHS